VVVMKIQSWGRTCSCGWIFWVFDKEVEDFVLFCSCHWQPLADIGEEGRWLFINSANHDIISGI